MQSGPKQESYFGDSFVQGAFSLRGTCWTAPQQISAKASDPQVAIDNLENVCTVWHTTDLANQKNVTQASTTSFGKPWEPPITISPLQNTQNCKIFIQKAGQAVAVWKNADTSTLQSAKFSGSWQPFQTYTPLPSITSVVPNFGSTIGGNFVVITGIHFTDATNVSFGTVSASFSVDSDSQISATVPPGTSGSVHITVTTPVGTSLLEAQDQYTYEASPTIISLTPNYGSISGGNQVVLTGHNFVGANAVSFGGYLSPNFTVNSTSQATVQVPSGSPGVVPVTVSSSSGVSLGTSLKTSQNNQYMYVTTPKISNLSITQGSTSGGEQVIITGSDFINASNVLFGANAANFSVDSNNQITATVPPEKASLLSSKDRVHVTVTTPEGTSDGYPYTYLSPFVPTPRKFYGKVYKQHSHHDKNFKLKTTWKHPHLANNVSSYIIYEDEKQKKILPATKKLKFNKHVRSSHHLHRRYSITAVGSTGSESAKKKLKIIKK